MSNPENIRLKPPYTQVVHPEGKESWELRDYDIEPLAEQIGSKNAKLVEQYHLLMGADIDPILAARSGSEDKKEYREYDGLLLDALLRENVEEKLMNEGIDPDSVRRLFEITKV